MLFLAGFDVPNHNRIVYAMGDRALATAGKTKRRDLGSAAMNRTDRLMCGRVPNLKSAAVSCRKPFTVFGKGNGRGIEVCVRAIRRLPDSERFAELLSSPD